MPKLIAQHSAPRCPDNGKHLIDFLINRLRAKRSQPIVISYLKINRQFLRAFQVYIKKKYREFPCGFPSFPFSYTASSNMNFLHPCGTFVTIDEPVSSHYYQLKSIVYVVSTMSFGKYMTTISYYSIIQNSCAALSISCVTPILPSFLPSNSWKLLIFLLFP